MKRHNNTNTVVVSKAKKLLIAIISAIIAIAIGITCGLCVTNTAKPVSIDDAQAGQAASSTTYSNLSGDQTAIGALKNNDVINFTFNAVTVNGTTSGRNGAERSIILPKGTYTFEAWGAQGGNAYSNGVLKQTGGKGGYSKATVTLAATTTIYIAIGGMGTTGTLGHYIGNDPSKPHTDVDDSGDCALIRGYGGWNGGGTSGCELNADADDEGGGGGGCTHISLGNRGELRKYQLYQAVNEVILVAGGGGAAGWRTDANTGGGGGDNGVDGTGGSDTVNHTPARGGVTTYSGGTYGVGGVGAVSGEGAITGFSSTGGPGSFGKGGDGGSGTTGGSGGGGGWYGGGAGGGGGEGGDGGGGSGYVRNKTATAATMQSNTNVSVTNGSTSTGSQTGHGAARITVNSVHYNTMPTSKNTSSSSPVASSKRIASTTVSIGVTSIANVPTGASNVYFSDHTSTNYDTFTTTANQRLWINDTCTTLATGYLNWTWTSNTTLNITKVFKYPRSGVDGAPANGVLKLYAKVRDDFQSDSTNAHKQRGYATVSFFFKVTEDTVSERTVTLTGSVGGKTYFVGRSNTTTAPTKNIASASAIYNPTANKYTAIAQNPLKMNESFTVDACALLSGSNNTSGSITNTANGTIYSGDKVYMGFSGASATNMITGKSRKFKIDQYESSTTGTTIYNLGGSAIAGSYYDKLTFTCVDPDSSWVVFPVTLYVTENTTAWSAKPRAVPNIAAVNVDIVFRVDNTRPVLKSDAVIDVPLGKSTTVSLATYVSDGDITSGITTATHAITEIKVPQNEFIQLDRYGNIVSTNASKYNVGSKTATSLTDGMTDTATGFNGNIIYNEKTATGGNTREAFMSFNYNANDVNSLDIIVTGYRPSYSQYTSSRAATAPGHFYLLVHITDKRESTDAGIWMPLAFTVGATTAYNPVANITTPNTTGGTSNLTNQNKTNDLPDATGKPGDTFYFAPMSVNYNGQHVIGQYLNDDGELTNEDLNPLAMSGNSFATYDAITDPTNVINGTGTLAWNSGKLHELLRFASTSTAEAIVKSVSESGYTYDSATGIAENSFIKAQLIDIYLPTTYFATTVFDGSRIVVGSGTNANGFKYVSLDKKTVDGTEYYVVNGLKLTLKSATMNRYFYANVGIVDASGTAVTNGVDIGIRIKNTAPVATKMALDATDKDAVATFFDEDNSNAYSTYAYDPDNADTTKRVTVPTFTYRVPLGSKVVVTPYDFVSDKDLTTVFGSAMSHAKGFTLNGLTGTYDTVTGVLSDETSVSANSVAFNGLFSKTDYGTTFLSGLTGTDGMFTALNKNATVKKVSRTAAKLDANTLANCDLNESVFYDRLFFVRDETDAFATTDVYKYNPTSFNKFIVTKTNVDGFIDCAFGNTVQLGSNSVALDFMLLTATTRTTQPAVIELAVRDRYGNSVDGDAQFNVRIVVEVVNTAPRVKDVNRYEEIAVSPIDAYDNVNATTVSFTANGNGTATGLMTDSDGDSPEFITSRGTLIANTNKLATIYPAITSFSEVARQYQTDDGETDGRLLTEYVSAALVSRFELTATAKSSTKAVESGAYVYFFVNDGNGGSTLGFVRVEVVNSSPVLNTSDNSGFDKNDPTWAIESTSVADISRARYIVGSQTAATALKNERGASDYDIKLIATDADGLHKNITLASVTKKGDGSEDFVKLNVAGESVPILRATFEQAVPDVAIATSYSAATSPAAILVYTSTRNAAGEYNDTAEKPADNYYVGMLFRYEDAWVTREQLLNNLNGKTIKQVSEYFDESGRWINTDWALHLQATEGFANNVRLGIMLSVRDVAGLGGDTAGLETAYNSDRREDNVAVVGSLRTTVYHTVSQTGIRTKDEYVLNYNSYYVVEHINATNQTTAYVSTYDGKTTESVYTAGDNVTDITYNVTSGKNMLVKNGTGSQTIKSRAVGSPDNTLAGVDSGAVYDAANLDSIGDGAYKYPSIIEVPADKTEVFVPMSFFGLLQDLVGVYSEEGHTSSMDGSVVYFDEYVGYDVSRAYARGTLEQISSAIMLSDGVSTPWTGSSLNNNPYITIDAFDDYSANGSTSSASKFTDKYSKPYYNNRLAVTTIDKDGELIGFEGYAANRDNFVGNGETMYLAEQATKLQEHNFGLSFTKKDIRTGTRDLTLTINLAKARGSSNVASSDSDKRTVTINIHIENSKIDLTTEKNVVHYDDGTDNTYYVDVTMPSASSQVFALSRYNATTQTVETISPDYSDANKVAYFDDDYNNESYRDKAYFLVDSLNKLSSWTGGAPAYTRAMEVNDDLTEFVNTAVSSGAQKSMLNYFGQTAVSDMDDVDGDYIPNDGKFGSTNEGYSSYFTASLTEGGQVINIMSSRQTYINKAALDKELGASYTQADVIELYKARGLVAQYSSSSIDPATPTRVYYPFKVLIYDSCGAGWGDASYVALEFRIQVTNADPSLRPIGDEVKDSQNTVIGREYRFKLAVGNSTTINLYDLVTDPDMFIEGTSGYYMIATQDSFLSNASGIDLETGDYLDSPFLHDEYLHGKSYSATNASPMGNGKYYRDGGGFSLMGDSSKDVTMWMETPAGTTAANLKDAVPTANSITFTVNRRSTAKVTELVSGKQEDKYVSIDEYRFTLKFYDSYGRSTMNFTFIISVSNQAPIITTIKRNFTMYAGDDLTLLTTYYDNFIGGVVGGSTAYNYSATKSYYDDRTNPAKNPGYGTSHGDGRNNSTPNGGFWKFPQINSELEDDIILDGTFEREAGSASIHLGYLGLADDDTPWRMRFSGISYDTVNSHIWVDADAFRLQVESDDATTKTQAVALNVRAVSACTNEPLTLTISDGENGFVNVTLYFTVISSPPVALDYGDSSDRILINNAGLEPQADGDGGYVSGVYRLFTVPSGVDSTSGNAPIKEVDCTVDGASKRAKSMFTINMTNVAKDPDGSTETSGMTLYGEGNFAVNGVPLVRNEMGYYSSDYFDIRVAQGGKSFTITSTGYNPDSSKGYEELTFVIADAGNGDYANTLEITLHIYTMYSDLTNPTVATLGNDSYSNYFKPATADVVHVKSCYEYYNAAEAIASKYAFVKLTGNTGNDGNTKSPIVDPDVTKAGVTSYTARLYAFIDHSGNEWKAISDSTLKNMFTLNKSAQTFTLKDGDYSEYLIGGITNEGDPIKVEGTARMRLTEVNRYVNFEFEQDGTALYFTPNTATLNNNNIMLYVEAEKYVDTSRAYSRDNAVLTAGSLFRLDVEDSAPVAVVDAGMEQGVNWVASGAKGDRITFKIHDESNPYGALFADSDVGDIVTVKAFTDADYGTALAKALDDNAWLKDEWGAGDGKVRAFDIEIDEAANTLTIVIKRRIDRIVDGKYVPSVSFPIEIEGFDLKNKKAKTTIQLTINNTAIGVDEDFTSKYDADTGVGYSLSRSDNGNYVIDAKVQFSNPLEINIFDFITDVDYTMAGDTESYVFANATEYNHNEVYPYKYLTDKIQDVYWYATAGSGDTRLRLATVEPLGTDEWHKTGIKITAVDTTRTLEAKTYLRIVDRSATVRRSDAADPYADVFAEDSGSGIFIEINITVMNDSPYVKDGKQSTSLVMTGTDGEAVSRMLFFIGDFVGDKNLSDVVGDRQSATSDTYLRIYSQSSLPLDSLYSTKYSSVADMGADSIDEVNSSSLFTVTIPQTIPTDLLNDYHRRMGIDSTDSAYKSDTTNNYNQWFYISPISGYYGSGAVEITVSDGDINKQGDTLTTTFRINVDVVINPNEMAGTLNPVSIACCKTLTIDIGMLMPELENKLDIGLNTQTLSARASDSTFSQAEYYTLTAVELQNSSDSDYAKFERVGNSSVWTLTAGRQVTFDPIRVNVRYALTSDPSKVYSKYFWLNIIANVAPKLRYSEITFVRYNRTDDILRDLDDSNTISLRAWQLFTDEDDPDGSALRFVSVKSQTPSLVSAKLSDDKQFLIINFAARGKSDITVEVTDETGTPVSLTFVAQNSDLPEGSLWLRIRASFETHMLIWVIVICIIVLLLIILFIIIAVLSKRKREREELEAILVHEMEIEEQMLKLAGGPSPTDYQSYGYLQSGGMPIDPATGMMLGEGLGEADFAAPPMDDGTMPPPDGNADLM